MIGDVKTGKAPADGTDELPKHEGFDDIFSETAHDGEGSNGSAATTATPEKAGAEWHTEFCSFKQQTQKNFEEQAEAIHGLKNQQHSTNKLASKTTEVLTEFTENQAELSRSVTRIQEISSDMKEAVEQLRKEQERHRKILDEIPAIKSQLEKIQQGSQVSQETHLIRLVEMITTQLQEKLQK